MDYEDITLHELRIFSAFSRTEHPGRATEELRMSLEASSITVRQVQGGAPASIMLLVVLALGFGVDVGVTALTVALVLVMISPGMQAKALRQMPWSASLQATLALCRCRHGLAPLLVGFVVIGRP